MADILFNHKNNFWIIKHITIFLKKKNLNEALKTTLDYAYIIDF